MLPTTPFISLKKIEKTSMSIDKEGSLFFKKETHIREAILIMKFNIFVLYNIHSKKHANHRDTQYTLKKDIIVSISRQFW